ncbi:MAG: hypothetical protein ACJAVK_002217, partial [Akkermansiaceae bacterium]
EGPNFARYSRYLETSRDEISRHFFWRLDQTPATSI